MPSFVENIAKYKAAGGHDLSLSSELMGRAGVAVKASLALAGGDSYIAR